MGTHTDLNPGYMAIDFTCRPRIVSCIYVFLHSNFPNSSIKTLLFFPHFLRYVDILGVAPRSALTVSSSFQGAASGQHSTTKDLTDKAGEEFRDKSLSLELHAERGWKQVQAPKGCCRADLGNPDGRSQGHRQQRSHVRGRVFMSTLFWTVREHRAHHVCWDIQVLLKFLYVSSFENMDWQRRDNYQEKASWDLPLDWIISLPLYRYQRGESC